ncbi:hypothetical protein [Microbacterium foliorum]|uniref:hypothetical protein n=1 Tax=Microbacterium foliorum TaxID=104336 RepID=UPI0028D28740|nr:hypothetical protein [Microbacterium foliorum]
MTSDSDDALSWDGDEGSARGEPVRKKPARTHSGSAAAAPSERPADDPTLPEGWNAVGRGSADVGRLRNEDEDEDERPPLSTGMLLTLGVVGGVYLLYSIGWVVGGMRLKPLANLIVADAMYMPWFVLAVAAPALWFLAVWVLTRARAGWIRVALLLLGVVLLVPWPFVTVGVIGS